jgi:YD repeat-containing protein
MSDFLFNHNNTSPELLSKERFNEKVLNSAYKEQKDTIIRTTSYEYDKTGNLIEVTNDTGKTMTYVFDSNNRMIKATDMEGNTSRFFYDEIGKIMKEVWPENYDPVTDDGAGITYYYDSMNRLKEVKNEEGSIVSAYIYDINGFVTTSTDASGYGTEYAYDLAGRLLSVSTPEAASKSKTSFRYSYDAMNHITKQNAPV